MNFQISDDPHLMIQFAREAVYAYSGHKDADQLNVAREAMRRASISALLPDYWIDRFSFELMELELTHLVGGHTPTAHAQCHKTLDAMELDFGGNA